MGDIERIIEETMKRVSESHKNSDDGQYALNLDDELAKAIEQYVVEARIEELRRLFNTSYLLDIKERIAQLEKERDRWN